MKSKKILFMKYPTLGIIFSFLFIFFLGCNEISAHWNSKGPFGGSVTCSIQTDTNIFIGTNGGGIYKSTDSRVLSWKAMNLGLGSGYVSGLTFVEKNIFAGTLDSGIYISNDEGNTWTAANKGLGSYEILSLFNSGGNVYAGTDQGVYESIDLGLSWKLVNDGLENLKVTCFAASGGKIFAGTNEGGVFVKSYNSNAWVSAKQGLGDLHILSILVNEFTVIVGTNGGVYKSSTSDVSWQLTNAGLENKKVYFFNIANDQIYAGTDSGIYSNVLQQNTWSALSGIQDTVTSISKINNLQIVGTKNAGIYTNSLGTAVWNNRNLNLNNLKSSALYTEGSLIIVATEKGIFVSKDLATNYKASNKGLLDSTHVSDIIADGNVFYASTLFGGVFKSNDTGRSWIQLNSGLQKVMVNKLSKLNGFIIAGGDNGEIYFLNTQQDSWVLNNSNLPTGKKVTALHSTGNILFAALSEGGVFKYENGIWSTFTIGLESKEVTSISSVGSSVFAATSNAGVYISDANTASWMPVNNGLPTLGILSLSSIGKILLAGYRGGVYVTADNGANWQSPNVLINIPPYAEIKHITFTTDRVFITTPNNSIYSNAKSELPGYIAATEKPVMFKNAGFTIVPNPNAGNFSVRILTGHSKISKLKIFDSLGRLMEVFDHEPEYIQVDYPKGIYIVQLEVDQEISMTQKLVIE